MSRQEPKSAIHKQHAGDSGSLVPIHRLQWDDVRTVARGLNVDEQLLARRAKGLTTAFPGPHFPFELGAEVIAFDSGFAAPELLPDLTTFAMQALTTDRRESLQYAPGQGQPDLRAWLAAYMAQDGCKLVTENLMIVNGAKHGLDLLCRLMLDEGDAIVVTAPTYFTAIPIFRSFGIEFVEVGQDAGGLNVAELEDTLARRKAEKRPPPKFIYNVADFHNPSGVTMSVERRKALIELAARERCAVIEDSPYRRVRFDDEAVPSLKALDEHGVVIHVGTFSKLIAPGLRIGWIAADRHTIARLIQLKSDGGTSPLMQRITYEFCRSTMFEAHLARVRATYRAKRDRMVAALQRELPELTLIVPGGGYYVWLTLPRGMDGDVFAERAAAVGVNLIAGSRFYALANAGNSAPRAAINHVRLSYSFATLEEIDEGIRRLGGIYPSLAV
jgi:2-aminoadipate transaminase